jgi:hypothetical protein
LRNKLKKIFQINTSLNKPSTADQHRKKEKTAIEKRSSYCNQKYLKVDSKLAKCFAILP